MPTEIIQWFPGHMAKTRRKIKEILPLIDAVCEVVDARVPVSSRNPDLAEIIGDKPRIVILNKCDMADSVKTAEWIEYYKQKGITAIGVDCKSGKGLSHFKDTVKSSLSHKLEQYAAKGMVGKPLRVMVVGIPNVGKSSFINRVAKGNKAKVENRPGVTLAKQWVQTEIGIDLLDMPGVLWPKFDDPFVGENLALTGAVKDDVIDTVELAAVLVNRLRKTHPDLLCARYKLTNEDIAEDVMVGDIFDIIGQKRGFLLRGGEINYDRAAAVILDEFRAAKIGRITLDILPQKSEV